MGNPSNHGYRYCLLAERDVSLQQTEGQCRGEHRCGDHACPLEARFIQARYPNAFALLTPFLSLGTGEPK